MVALGGTNRTSRTARSGGRTGHAVTARVAATNKVIALRSAVRRSVRSVIDTGGALHNFYTARIAKIAWSGIPLHLPTGVSPHAARHSSYQRPRRTASVWCDGATPLTSAHTM